MVVGGDLNASLLFRIGYAGLPHIQAADVRLSIFLHDAGLAYQAPGMQGNMVMWCSSSGQASVSGAEAIVSRTLSSLCLACNTAGGGDRRDAATGGAPAIRTAPVGEKTDKMNGAQGSESSQSLKQRSPLT